MSNPGAGFHSEGFLVSRYDDAAKRRRAFEEYRVRSLVKPEVLHACQVEIRPAKSQTGLHLGAHVLVKQQGQHLRYPFRACRASSFSLR